MSDTGSTPNNTRNVEIKNDVGNPIPVSGTVSVNALPAGTNNIGDVDVVSVVPGTAATNLGKAEDDPHASGDVGVAILAVRNDVTGNVLTSADGDYSPIAVDSAGRIRLSAAKMEDDAHVSGDTGIPAWGVRNDADTVLTSANGDYSPVAVDSAGRIKVVGSLTTSIDSVNVFRTITQTSAGVVIKNTAGSLRGFNLGYNSTGEVTVRLYDKATVPTTADTPILTIVVREGRSGEPFPFSIDFVNGLGIRATKGTTSDTETTAIPVGEIAFNIYYT